MENTLIQIYNTLATIETKGENTLKMASCLNALGQVIEQMQTDQEQPSQMFEGDAE